jgi:hypothetical protein
MKNSRGESFSEGDLVEEILQPGIKLGVVKEVDNIYPRVSVKFHNHKELMHIEQIKHLTNPQ